jgi:uncharacterized protein (DUF1697 family)
MAQVVFLRGVNVGGHKKFSPSALARELELANVGAAGTFVARRAIGARALREAIAARLPFDAEIMVCPAAEIAALVERAPFSAAPDGVRPFVSILAAAPRARPRLPLERPAGGGWQVRLLAVDGRYALSVRRPQPRGTLYPNEVVEKELGVAATTRGWPTLLAIRKLL